MEAITTEELEQFRESDKEFRLVDVLEESHFKDEHIPGAENIPLNEIAIRALDEIDEDETVVVYCKDENCSASPKAAEKLEKIGYENVKDYQAGLKGWKKAGNPTES